MSDVPATPVTPATPPAASSLLATIKADAAKVAARIAALGASVEKAVEPEALTLLHTLQAQAATLLTTIEAQVGGATQKELQVVSTAIVANLPLIAAMVQQAIVKGGTLTEAEIAALVAKLFVVGA